MKMKDSGIEWLGKIPEGWEVKKTKYLIDSRDGGAWGEDPTGNSNDVICLRIADFDYFIYRFKEKEEYTVRNYKTTTIEKLVLKHGDILIEKSGGGDKVPVGRAVIFNKNIKALYANFMDRLRTKEAIYPLYFLYTWNSYYENKYMLNFVNQTTGIQNLDITNILNVVEFPVPSYSEQKKIADYLNFKCTKIDEVNQIQLKIIEKLKEYKQALITEAVDNHKYTKWNLGYLSTFKNGLNYIASDVGEKYKFLNVGDFQNYLVLDKEEMFSDIITTTEVETDYYLKSGDIIFVRSNGSKDLVGRAVMVQNVDFPVTYSGFCIRLRNVREDIVDSKYLLYFFRSFTFRNELTKNSQGSNISNINQDLLSHIKVAVPELKDQLSIVQKLDKQCAAIDDSIEKKQQIIEKLAEYKKSLIYECVTGKREV